MTRFEELDIEDLDIVSGGDTCVHGTGTCGNGSGKGDGLGWLRGLEGNLIQAGKNLVNTIIGMF